MSDKLIEKILEIAQKNWRKPDGLLCLVLLVTVFTFGAVKALELMDNHYVLCGALVGADLLAVLIWWLSNRFPQNPKDKVGVTVCIHCYDVDEKNKIKEDFIDSLKKFLRDSPQGRTFNLLEIPDRLYEKIENTDAAFALLKKTRSHFIIYGRVRKRTINDKDHHFLELDGAVTHNPIPSYAHKQFSKEFGELLPKKLRFPVNNDLLGFDFTSEVVGIVAQYIIAVAAAVSFDYDFSESLFQGLKNQIKAKNSNPIYEKLKERVPRNIIAINLARTNIAINRWFKTHDRVYVSQITGYLAEITKQGITDDYHTLILRGLEAFLVKRDVARAKSFFKQCQGDEDPIWQLNLAFLYAYENDLKKFARVYRKFKDVKPEPYTVDQIESFFVWILEVEPEKFQFHYCLGYFNWKIKGDFERASLDFKLFLNKCPDGKFTKEVELAKEYLRNPKYNSNPTVLE